MAKSEARFQRAKTQQLWIRITHPSLGGTLRGRTKERQSSEPPERTDLPPGKDGEGKKTETRTKEKQKQQTRETGLWGSVWLEVLIIDNPYDRHARWRLFGATALSRGERVRWVSTPTPNNPGDE